MLKSLGEQVYDVTTKQNLYTEVTLRVSSIYCNLINSQLGNKIKTRI